MLHRSLAVGALLGLLGVAFAQTPPLAPAAGPVTYKLDATKGFLYVQVFKDPTTMAAGLSHDHVVRSRSRTGTATWDPANPAACAVDITVPVKQLEVDAPEMRKKVGYDTTLDDSQRAEVGEHIFSDTQLDAAKFPNISFKATKCEGTGSNAKVTGNFTLHGR